MRNHSMFISMVVLMTWPIMSQGNYARLDLVDHNTGSNVIYLQPNQTSITIDVILNTDLNLEGIQYSITANKDGLGSSSGDGDWKYDVNQPWTNGNMFPGGAYIIGVGTLGGGFTLAEANTNFSEIYLRDYPLTVTGTGVVATYKLEIDSLLMGYHYILSAVEDPSGYGNCYVSNGLWGAWSAGGLLHIITPDPTSLSLLALGGLAVMRRKRA